MAEEKIIGIDLGTSNSAASFYDGVKAEMIPAVEGKSLYGKAFPSYVAFTEDGQMLVGEAAKVQSVTNPENTITEVKKLMGSDEKIEVNGKSYSPQQISGFILQKIKKDSEEYIGEKITKAVITVPANFDDNQRTATKDAGTIAGLDVVALINEPTAAAIAYGIDKTDEEELNIMVYDFGGGTLDVTIMKFSNNKFKVKATSGDTHLGGTDMDELLIKYIVEEFESENGIDLLDDITAQRRLKESAEKVKIKLSNVPSADIIEPFIAIGKNGKPLNLNMTITRAKLEELVEGIVEKSAIPMQQALDDAKMSKSDIDKIILIGGPTRMPIVREFVEDFIGKKSDGGVDPMECVSMGASILASNINNENPDGESDAGTGASGISFVDVTPLSLGTRLYTGLTSVLIERNTEIPVKRTKVFSTIEDNQKEVEIEIVQGERAMADDNTSLGMFLLDGIPKGPKGTVKIEITYSIDRNGILNVSAREKETGIEQSITITSPNKLSEEEIAAQIEEAEEFSREDDKRREVAKLKNDYDTVIRKAKDFLIEYTDFISNEEKEEINKAMHDLENAMKNNDPNEIRMKINVLDDTIPDISGTIN